MIWLPNLVLLSAPDEGYATNPKRALRTELDIYVFIARVEDFKI